MKNLLIYASSVILTVHFVYAGNYETAMSAAIEKLYAANEINTYLESSATFERIAMAEKTKWLPYYYAGLGYIWASNIPEDVGKIDQLLEKAQNFIDEAKKLSPQNDEIVTLQGYIYMMKVAVDPPSRGPEFSGLAMQEFGRAVGLNPENPRALLLLGRMQMGTDQFFGNDLSESCAMINKAASMFENQKVETEIDPAWGREMAVAFVVECKSN